MRAGENRGANRKTGGLAEGELTNEDGKEGNAVEDGGMENSSV